MYDTYCLINYQNGHCDNGCDTADCDWDGLDCDDSPAQILPGKLYLIVLMSVEEFRMNMVGAWLGNSKGGGDPVQLTRL